LLAIVDGRKSIEESRANTRNRVARHRAAKKDTSVTVTDSPAKGVTAEEAVYSTTSTNDPQVFQAGVIKAIAGTKVADPGAKTDTPAKDIVNIRDWKTGQEYVERHDHGNDHQDPAATAAPGSIDDAPSAWDSLTPEDRRFVRDRALADLSTDPDALRAFFDRLGVPRMQGVMSDEYGRALRAALPGADPCAWLVEKDAGTIAQKIVETVGTTKAGVIRKHLPDSAPKPTGGAGRSSSSKPPAKPKERRRARY
jgi:hypothetical protein